MRSRRFLIISVLGAVALGLGLSPGGTAPAATTTLFADVGPGYTITLTDAAGAPVTQLTPGAYTIVVNDQSVDHNFHLTGPGGVDLATTVPFLGQETWAVTLVDGSYHFVCDPHADGMFGDFTVAAPADTTAPETTLESGPSGTVGSTAATFGFGSNEPGASFECALDGAAFAACSSPASYAGLADGAHTFAVRAVDAAGNVDASPASASWTVDTSALYATVGPGYTISLTDAAGAPVSSLQPGTYTIVVHDQASVHNFHLLGPGVDQTTTVEFVGEQIWTLTLGAGSYRFQCDPHPGMDGSFQVADTIPPETTIDSGPSGSVNTTAATFAFSATEPDSTFECSLDGAAFELCSSPVSYVGLLEGAHTFEVRATDAAGNLDTSPASAAWTVDTTLPETVIDSGPSGTVGETTAAFAFSAGEPGASFECALDGAAFAACTSPASLIGLADGAHTFAVRATDAAGNTDPTPAERTWTVDTAAPETTITLGPSGIVDTASATFEFAADDAGARFECALDGAAFAACTSPQSYSGLANGQHTFAVRAIDAVGNADPTPAERAWTVQVAAPAAPTASGDVRD
jgi:plastocyanin